MIEAKSPRPSVHSAALSVSRGTVSPRSRRAGRVVAVVGLACLVAGCSLLGITEDEEETSEASAATAAAPVGPRTAVSLQSLQAEGVYDGVVAVIDGEPITLRELKLYGVEGAPFLPPSVRSDYRSLLDSMIEQRLLRAEFKKNGVTASDQMVNKYIDSVLEENNQTRAALQADIAKSGLTWSSYFDRMRDEVQRIQLVNLLIRSRVNMPEEEVRRAWEEDPQYLQSEKLKVAAIFVPAEIGAEEASKRRADEVRTQAKSNFSKAAKEHSKGPAAEDGGEMGSFERGSMASHYEKGLQGLGEGDVSVPIEGPGGYYIIKLLDVETAGRRPFEDVKEKLADDLYDKRLNERYAKWLSEDLRKDHRIEYLVDSLAVDASGS